MTRMLVRPVTSFSGTPPTMVTSRHACCLVLVFSVPHPLAPWE
jgi:hypothetical protein